MTGKVLKIFVFDEISINDVVGRNFGITWKIPDWSDLLKSMYNQLFELSAYFSNGPNFAFNFNHIQTVPN